MYNNMYEEYYSLRIPDCIIATLLCLIHLQMKNQHYVSCNA